MEEKKKYAIGKHPNSLKNLKPCKPGETRNPHGRPRKEQSVTEALRVLLREGTITPEMVAKSWLSRSLKSPKDLEMLLDRTEGKVTQPEEGEITLRVIYEDDRCQTA